MSRRQPRRAATAAVLLLAGLVGACGFRTEPRPPEDTAPVIDEAVTATLRKDGTVRLGWSRADESVDGERLWDLAGFRIERSVDGQAWESLGRVEVADRDRIRKGGSFQWIDKEPPVGRLRYRVVAYLTDGQTGPPTSPAAVDHRPPEQRR